MLKSIPSSLRALAFCGALLVVSAAHADEPAEQSDPEPRKLLNLRIKTFGGRQFWTDELVCHQWRIQRNVLTNHCRLLDDKNVRQAWGSFEACRQRFDQLRRERNVPEMDGKVVLVLHGLVRSRNSMSGLCDYLSEQGDFQVVNVSYASTRAEIGQHAEALGRIISNLPHAQEIHLVAHSMGNLVIRRYWADQTDPAQGLRPDPRIRRIVMLAPPNDGSRLAEFFENDPLFRLAWGVGGQQIADWTRLEDQLATPTCSFGIMAGNAGKNPLLPGDDDLVVAVTETRLPGAADFTVVPGFHSFIMDLPVAQQRVLNFLQHGYFESPQARAPIPAAR